MTTNSRDALLRAAQELYAENGVAATTPNQVLQQSGIGQGSLYHHFPSKHDLAVAAVARTVEEALASSAAVVQGDAGPRARLAAYLERPRNATAGCRIGRLTADPFVAADEALSALVAGYFGDLVDLLTAVIEDQGQEADAARDRATAAVAVIQGGYVLSRAAGDDEPMRSAVRGFLGLMNATASGEGHA
ncbi:TetR/AcrR family transcriptional regulator [Microbacterium paraoxydans]|uniref:TetR/AcrR family transcriptional regulator n=1 Tax=Microbacterium paraoxydans TaxID=199592 RepID=UPI003D738C56